MTSLDSSRTRSQMDRYTRIICLCITMLPLLLLRLNHQRIASIPCLFYPRRRRLFARAISSPIRRFSRQLAPIILIMLISSIRLVTTRLPVLRPHRPLHPHIFTIIFIIIINPWLVTTLSRHNRPIIQPIIITTTAQMA